MKGGVRKALLIPKSPPEIRVMRTVAHAKFINAEGDAELTITVPPEISFEYTFSELDERLFPQERDYLRRSVEGRVVEFTTVRACARRALLDLGYQRPPLLATGGRGPGWPKGIVGSMTHCEGFRAAAVGSCEVWIAIGIDAEPNAPLTDGVLMEVAGPAERLAITRLQALQASIAWDRLLFSAKEAIYKAWSPLTHGWLGFEEAFVEFELGSFEFRATLTDERGLECPPLTSIRGRWYLEDDYLVTAVFVPRYDSRTA